MELPRQSHQLQFLQVLPEHICSNYALTLSLSLSLSLSTPFINVNHIGHSVITSALIGGVISSLFVLGVIVVLIILLILTIVKKRGLYKFMYILYTLSAYCHSR